jgi:hypothetical protein
LAGIASHLGRVRDQARMNRADQAWHAGAVISMEDPRKLEAAEDEADLAAAREALASDARRTTHTEVLAEYGVACGILSRAVSRSGFPYRADGHRSQPGTER